MQPVDAPDAPAAIGPYSHAVATDGLLFCSGQIPVDPATGAVVDGDIGAQTAQVLSNLAAVLAADGLTLANVVKTTVFLTDLDDFGAMNAVYAEAFGDWKPARAAVQVSRLPKGVAVEIEAIAARR